VVSPSYLDGWIGLWQPGGVVTTLVGELGRLDGSVVARVAWLGDLDGNGSDEIVVDSFGPTPRQQMLDLATGAVLAMSGCDVVPQPVAVVVPLDAGVDPCTERLGLAATPRDDVHVDRGAAGHRREEQLDRREGVPGLAAEPQLGSPRVPREVDPLVETAKGDPPVRLVAHGSDRGMLARRAVRGRSPRVAARVAGRCVRAHNRDHGDDA